MSLLALSGLFIQLAGDCLNFHFFFRLFSPFPKERIFSFTQANNAFKVFFFFQNNQGSCRNLKVKLLDKNNKILCTADITKLQKLQNCDKYDVIKYDGITMTSHDQLKLFERSYANMTTVKFWSNFSKWFWNNFNFSSSWISEHFSPITTPAADKMTINQVL